jgi:hypothetical protein
MRPQADEVEFLYEIMSVTGEAMVMMMICLNYLKSIEVIEMEPIPPLARAVLAAKRRETRENPIRSD